GVLSGRILLFFLKRPTWFVGTTLVGNVTALLLFGILATKLIAPWLLQLLPASGIMFLISIVLTFALTVIVLYTVEFFSKSLFIINANKLLIALAVPFVILYGLLFPLVFSLVALSRLFIVHVLRIDYSEEKPLFGITDIDNYLKSIHHLEPEEEDIELDRKIFNNALEFKSVRVRDCMIPRTEITAVGLESGIKKLQEAFIESGHSKIIIFKESIDDIIGYCHSSALFNKPSRIEEILTPIIIVPETTLANELMVRFINERK
ncbi:MAG: CNNM domain-containing protein, partial [Bacteroidota bacterium]